MSRTLPRPIRGRGKSLASMAFISVLLSGRRACEPARAAERRYQRDSSVRQRNELVFPEDMGKTAGFPVLFGLFDPLLAGGDEIPPDMARSLQRVAAEEHHPHRFHRLHRDAVAGPEDQKPWRLVALARDFDLAVDQIDRTLLMIGIE